MKVQQLVVTRLTVTADGASRTYYKAFAPEWLEERLRLFRTYCAPSIAGQTHGDFRWLVLCDESTDENFLEGIREFGSVAPQLRVVLTSGERGVEIPDAMATGIDDDTDVVVTTRLDGDDALHEEMLALAEDYVEPFLSSGEQRWVLNYPRGYRYKEQEHTLWESHWLNGAFATVLERLRPGEGFYNPYESHSTLHLDTPVHFDQSMHAWLQTIHGRASDSERRGTAVAAGNMSSTGNKNDLEVDISELRGFGVDLGEPQTRAR